MLAAGTLADHERAIHDEPGPYSVYGYLDQLLQPRFYSDELCLLIVSMIWRVHITILHAVFENHKSEAQEPGTKS